MKRIIPFYEKRFIYFAISGLVMLAGIAALFINGVKLDIQFKGGAILKYAYVGEIDPDKAAETAADTLNRLVDTQVTQDLLSGENKLVLNLAGNTGLDATDQKKLDTALKDEFPEANMSLSESSMVEPFFGRRFLENGILAIALASALIVLYVWMRFRKISGLSAGVMALVALLHDLLTVFFTCVIFQIPLGDSFVAIALTIIGYSINDTIVIYDRIRENARIDRKMPVDQLVNKSITQSLSRSINTNLAVFISVLLIYIFAFAGGIDSIQRFALPMVVGTVSGCYSTVCIAGPLWAMWQKRNRNGQKRLAAS
jgi:preprotein translocase SecF subunit